MRKILRWWVCFLTHRKYWNLEVFCHGVISYGRMYCNKCRKHV